MMNIYQVYIDSLVFEFFKENKNEINQYVRIRLFEILSFLVWYIYILGRVQVSYMYIYHWEVGFKFYIYKNNRKYIVAHCIL